MADVTLTSLEVVEGVLHIHGSNFTQTTTTVAVDDIDTAFSYIDATELTVDPAPDAGAEVVVSKNGVDAGPEAVPDADAPPEEAAAPETPVPPVTPETDLPSPGQQATMTAQELAGIDSQAIAAGTWPNPIDGFRAAVAGVALVGLIPVGDEKTPYPTGTQLGAGKKFWLQTGYYKSATPT